MKHEDPIPGTDKLPRSIEPERDLWPSIEARIQERKVVRPRFNQRAARHDAPTDWRRWGLLAAAAMLLVTISSGVTAYLVSGPPVPTGPVETAVPQPGFATVAWDEFQAAEREYERVTDDLLAALDASRDELAPETVELVEANLRLIDQAIQEARSALERDPSNARLALKLNDIYRKRVTFLREMSRL